MKEILSEIILDSLEFRPDAGIPRSLEITHISGKATICTGVRRAGKSTYLFQVIDRLVSDGVDPRNILYLNLFDDRLHGLGSDNLHLILEAYYGLYPEKKNRETVYFFFDEIQVVPGWESFVDRLLRSEKSEVWLSGSSAEMLSKEIGTRMRGRALSWEIFPFSFEEFLRGRDVEVATAAGGKVSTGTRLLLQREFEEYRSRGGFPEVVNLERRLRVKVHQEYFNAILYRDMVERHNISHPNALLDLAHRLVANVGSLYSLNKLKSYLDSLGHTVPKGSISDYLRWFEDAYFLFSLQIYDASVARRKANPRKIYAIDHGLVTSISHRILVNTGHLLENMIFVGLRRVTPEIYYYRTEKGHEVDFIYIMPDGSRHLLQVAASLDAGETEEREVRALRSAMKEIGVDRGTIVTLSEERVIEVDEGVVEVVAAWRFLLRHDRQRNEPDGVA